MKRFSLFIILIFISWISFSQEWINSLPQDKLQDGTLTFFEIQNAFNEYWEPYDVKNGYYILDGEEVKAPYWKQFRRWEWYWEPRVNPVTGEFPDMKVYDHYYQSQADNRSLAGNWISSGPNISTGGYAGLGRLNCVSFVPGSPQEYYAGAASGGIWKTFDDGVNWTVLNDTVPVIGVSDILVVDPVTGPDILYIATGDRDRGSLWSLGGQQSNDNNSIGVLKSIDGGASWQTTGLSFPVSSKVRLNRLLMVPNSAYQIIYAATTQGLYKTLNAGVSWSLLTTTAFIDLEFHPTNATTLYGSTQGNPTSIYLSVDAGNTWNFITSNTGARTELATSPNIPNYVYALVAATNGGLQGVYQSIDNGATYNMVFNGSSSNLLGWSCSGGGTGGQGSYDLCIAADPNNANVVYIGGVNTWKSSDGGTTFNIVNHWTGCGPPSNAQNVHADKHFLAFQNNTSTLFECNDGGLYKTSDGGVNWSHLSSGMAISQIYRMGIGQTNPDEIIIGLQDNGSKAKLNGNWTDIIGGDGFECIIDYTDENIQYGTLYYGDIYKTTNYWTSSTQITTSLPGSGWWCTPYLMDPVNSQTLYVGYSDVWKTTDGGSSWNQISLQGSTTDFRSMAISASNTNYIYAATLDDIYRTINGGGATQAWSNITSNLPVSSSNITYVSVKSDAPDHIWVSMGGYNTHGVYESTNGGSSWSNISAGLPQMPVMCVIQNTQYTAGIELYAATDIGVYAKRDGANWFLFSSGLPNVVVTELEIYYYAGNPANSKLYAATFGRGVWESNLYSPWSQPTADFSGTPTSGIIPLVVQFTDLSIDSVNTWSWDFGDGNASTDQNPLYTYNTPGTYTVTLTVSGPGGSDSEAKTDYIIVSYPAPAADFSGTPTTGIFPLDVQFNDLSVDTVNAWTWYFGNGDISNDQDPLYTYNDPGTYTVSLVVSGPGGTDSIAKPDYIVVSYPVPVALFMGNPVSGNIPLMVQFTDLTADTVNLWDWDFGDGGQSALQDPSHTYIQTGAYTVTLTASGPGGQDTEVKTNYINVFANAPVADFSGSPTAGYFPLQVDFTDMSTGDVSDWMWYFGDGNTSTTQDPSHTYNLAGTYSVSLKIVGPGGFDSINKVDYINVLVGLGELSHNGIKVYPNPFNELITIEGLLNAKQVILSDLTGVEIYNQVLSGNASEVKINTSGLSNGIYFCRIIRNNGSIILAKLIKK
ncbi:PKD domain-containing protein [Bacteroidota bacterium]